MVIIYGIDRRGEEEWKYQRKEKRDEREGRRDRRGKWIERMRRSEKGGRDRWNEWNTMKEEVTGERVKMRAEERQEKEAEGRQG